MKLTIICVSLCTVFALSASAQDNKAKPKGEKPEIHKCHPDSARPEAPRPPKDEQREARPAKYRMPNRDGERFNTEKLAERRANRLREELSLDEKQYSAVYQLCLEDAEAMENDRKAEKAAAVIKHKAQAESIAEKEKAEKVEKVENDKAINEKAARPQPHARQDARRQEFDKKLKAILTEEQAAKYDELQAKRAAERGEHRRPDHHGPRPDAEGARPDDNSRPGHDGHPLPPRKPQPRPDNHKSDAQQL